MACNIYVHTHVNTWLSVNIQKFTLTRSYVRNVVRCGLTLTNTKTCTYHSVLFLRTIFIKIRHGDFNRNGYLYYNYCCFNKIHPYNALVSVNEYIFL